MRKRWSKSRCYRSGNEGPLFGNGAIGKEGKGGKEEGGGSIKSKNEGEGTSGILLAGSRTIECRTRPILTTM